MGWWPYTHARRNRLLFAKRQRGIFNLHVGCANTQGTSVILSPDPQEADIKVLHNSYELISDVKDKAKNFCYHQKRRDWSSLCVLSMGVSMTFPRVSTPTLFSCKFIVLWCYLFLVATSSNLILSRSNSLPLLLGSVCMTLPAYVQTILSKWYRSCLFKKSTYYQSYPPLFIPKMTYSPDSKEEYS